MARFRTVSACHFLFLCFIPLYLEAKQKQSLILKVEDPKEFKKLQRTKTNLLVVFAKSDRAFSQYNAVLEDVADEIKGKATLASVDCSDAKKLCKNLKVSPSPLELRHYKDGDFNKIYDRKMVTKSIVNFLLDPTGDPPWEEEPDALDVVHINSEQAFKKLLKKEKHPLLVMFYAPWCGFCKRIKPDFAAAATALKGQNVLVGIDVDKPHQMALRAEYNITGFPTIFYFEEGKVKMKYGGENNKDGIISWLKDPKPAEEAKKEPDWSEQETDVLFLHDDNFADFIQTHPSVLVMFYAPWCGHCKKMKPEYDQAAEKLKADGVEGVLAGIDATVDKQLAEKYQVKGFPTLKYFKDGEFAWDLNERTADKVIEFMSDPKEPPAPPPPEPSWEEVESDVHHLNEETFKSFMKKKKHCLVMYYAPWCGHCKKAKPEFAAAAAQFKEDTKVAFAAFDCTVHASVCTAHDVTGYPTFKYFNYGKNAQKYMGGREENDFVNFMKDPLMAAAPTPPTPAAEPLEQWSDVEGHQLIHFLTASNFDSFMTQHDSVLVMFYAPWCGHCKAMKPTFGEVATTLKQQGMTGLLVAIDATIEESLGTRFAVRGYPTLKYFKNGQFAFDYQSGRKAEDIIKFMKDPQEPPPPPPPEPAWATIPSAVKHLSTANFTTFISNTKAVLVMFYAPWCGHCKKAKGDYQNAAGKLTEPGRALAAVDCTTNGDLCTKEEVKGFPTLKLYIGGEFLSEFNGDRVETEFLSFIQNAPLPDTKEEL